MEKALNTPSNVLIYKQHWDHYSKTPGIDDLDVIFLIIQYKYT